MLDLESWHFDKKSFIVWLMFYKSDMPKIVGEFDAASLHQHIAKIAAERPGLSGYEMLKALAGDTIPYPGIEDIIDIKWARLFRPGAFESFSTDGQVNDLLLINDNNRHSPIDAWHADTSDNRLQVLPEVLTTASRWPTEFLVGKIAVLSPDYMVWDSKTGQYSIGRALDRGDVHLKRFEAGQVLKVPKGTLHRRNIPAGSNGYRYFMRKFPRFSTFRAGTNIGRIRPF